MRSLIFVVCNLVTYLLLP